MAGGAPPARPLRARSARGPFVVREICGHSADIFAGRLRSILLPLGYGPQFPWFFWWAHQGSNLGPAD